jgi:HupE / UreJ protein
VSCKLQAASKESYWQLSTYGLWLATCSSQLVACNLQLHSPAHPKPLLLSIQKTIFTLTTMQDFKLYFGMGTEHILSWDALDHLLFVTALCIGYTLQDWKKVALLVTAFTIGHSLTLALSALNLLSFPVKWIEFLIPLTILSTALLNIFRQNNTGSRRPVYALALLFGLIHGMAFAANFNALEGSEGLVAHLFAFNIGIELAQLLVVGGLLLLSFILLQLLKIPRRGWVVTASAMIVVFSIKWAIERYPL